MKLCAIVIDRTLLKGRQMIAAIGVATDGTKAVLGLREAASAARNLEEGMEETLTVHKLRMPEMLRESLASTNSIESAFSSPRICADR